MKNIIPTTIECDVCIIGSGAGGGPIAYELSKAGFNVIILEKGGFYDEKDFKKDEMTIRRQNFRSKFKDERHVLEIPEDDESWSSDTTDEFWGGNIVGGASNFMSAYFYRLKPEDFRLLSEFGPIDGANVVDWPISYEELEPYYSKVESVIGISGKVKPHPFQEPRSTKDFPFPPTIEHPIADWFDKATTELGLNPLVMSRGILSMPYNNRKGCEYSGYCGSYGCHSAAKGSSRAALLPDSLATGNCEIITHAKVFKINTDQKGNAASVDYYDVHGDIKNIRAKIVTVSCYSIESSRLLLSSTGPKHTAGIGNRYGQIGKNLHCCAGGVGHGIFDLSKLSLQTSKELRQQGPFFNRSLQDWYIINDKTFSKNKTKGGTIDFVFDPPSPTSEANNLKRNDDGQLIWGKDFKSRLKSHFTQSKNFKFEVFCDWLPTDNCFVSLDGTEKDKWNSPVARVKAGFHQHDLKVGQYLVNKGVQVMKQMGADEYYGNVYSEPTSNLVAGGLRFGNNPKTSALDKDCRVHGTDNLFVTDGSFMPNGGSVTPTWTIYANSFRVADKIKQQLGILNN